MAEKQVVAFGPFNDFIADGVRLGDTIHLSGAVSVDEQGQTVHAGDIVHETLFVTDMSAIMGGEDKMGAFFGMRGEAYGGNLQVSQSLIGVKELVMPELLIEIKVVAHL